MQKQLRTAFLALLLAACSGSLPHEGSYDPSAPLEKQARATLRGVVVLEGESDAANVGIRIENETRSYSYTTANDGVINQPGIVPGTYSVTVFSRYFSPATQSVTFTLGEKLDVGRIVLPLLTARVSGIALANLVTGNAAELVGGVALRLIKSASIRGEASGAPAFQAAATSETESYSATSASDGSWSIDDVPAGVYEISASHPDASSSETGTVEVTGDGDVIASEILLQPLTGFFIVKGDGATGKSELYTRTRIVQLTLSGFNAQDMKIGRSATGLAAGCDYTARGVETYDAFATHDIPAEGLETICVRYIDEQGNETADLLGQIYYDETPPTYASIVINDGDVATETQTVTLRLSATDALSQSDNGSGLHAYQVTTGPAEPLTWDLVQSFPFVTNTLYTLSGSGTHTLWARYQDNAGLWSNPVSDTIDISTVEPVLLGADVVDENGASILAGSTTRSSRVFITSSINTETTLQMQVSSTGSFSGVDWEEYSAERGIDLQATTGYAKESRTIGARVRDPVGRIIEIIPGRSFFLDTRAPTGTVSNPAIINADANNVVPLTLAANDSETVVEVSEDPAFTTRVTFPYQTAYDYTLAAGADGTRTIYVRFSDAVGNSETETSEVVVDTVAPVAVFSIPSGALAASSILPVAVAADADTSLMLLSNSPDFTGASWQSYQPLFTWIFPGVEGDSILYGKFADLAGNESDAFSVTVTIDTSPPVIGGVSGAVLSDTILWDHLGPDVTGYTVKLYNAGQIVSVTHTTEKRLKIGKMGPGYTVVANYADGSQSNASLPPGYYVPATVTAFIGSRLDADSNTLLNRIVAQYGLGSTSATECGQVAFISQYNYDYNGSPFQSCDEGSFVKFPRAMYLQTPPPFYPAVVPGADNPFAGLSGPVRISGSVSGVYGYGGNDNGAMVSLITQPTEVRWPTSYWPQVYPNTVLASGSSYDPVSGRGANRVEFGVALSAIAMMDDLTYSTTPFTGTLEEFGYLEATDYPLTPGIWAGVTAETLTIHEPSWETYLTFNHLWDGAELYQSYYRTLPGTLSVPFAVNYGSVDGSRITLSNTRSDRCYYDWLTGQVLYCEYTGSNYVIDLADSSLTIQNNDPYGYYYGEIGLSNADGSRGYRFNGPRNEELRVSWSSETDQPVFEEIIRNVLHKLAAPTRVRSTGKPVLRSDVPDAVAMQVSTTGSFTNSVWVDYASEVTLAEGTTVVYVKYKDEAGNVTTTQTVTVSAPTLAPRLDEVAMLGAGANPGFSTSVDLNAYFIGVFGNGLRARVSTSPIFEDADWQELPDPLTELSFVNPFTGEEEIVTFEDEEAAVTILPMTIPDEEGYYTYWFWVADENDNFSLPVSATVFYDGTAPSAEFSVKPSSQNGRIEVQARWTVTRTSYAPSLTTPTAAAATEYTLPFYYPFNGVTSNTLKFHPDKSACFKVGTLSACALSGLGTVPERFIYQSAQQVTLVWKTEDFYGIPITAAATILPNGNVRLTYWQTNAKVSMAGAVDTVDTPYSDWNYAIVSGTVEYAQNSGNIQIALRSDQGNLALAEFSNSKKNGNCSPCGDSNGDGIPDGGATAGGGGGGNGPWQTVEVDDKGFTTYTGTAYSLAGEPGRVTVREVTIPLATYDKNSNFRATPLSDAKHWLQWDLDEENDSLLYKVAGRLFGPGGVVGGISHEMIPVFAEQFYPGYNFKSAELSTPLVLRNYETIAATGAAVTIDFQNQMMYGADGSIWDISNPVAPTPLKVFAGSYPFNPVKPLRHLNLLWATSGVWDISDPENPVWLMNNPLGAYAMEKAYYKGRIYRAGGLLDIYDASNPGASTSVDYSGAPTNLWLDGVWIQGNRLFSTTYLPNGIDGGGNTIYDQFAVEFDLTDPDAPVVVGPPMLLPYQNYMHYENGEWLGSDNLISPSGSLFAYQPGYALLGVSIGKPLFNQPVESGPELSVPVGVEYNNLTGAGPWIYATGGDTGMSVYGVGRTWPMKGKFEYITDADQLGIDEKYIYVCSYQNNTLTVYDFAWNVIAAKSEAQCGQNAITSRAPYVDTGAGMRYRLSGNSLVEDPVRLCEGTNCSNASTVGNGTVFAAQMNLWPTPDRSVPTTEDCYPLGSDGDIVYCGLGGSQSEIYGTTLSALRYAGIVTTGLELPVVRLIDDNSQFFSAGFGFVSTYAHTYRVYGLGKVVEIGRGQLHIIAPDLAFHSGESSLYQLTEQGAVRVAKLPLNGASQVAVSPEGDLIASTYPGNSQAIYSTRWGPALPEVRYEFDDLNQTTAIVEAGGLVFVGDSQGIVRLDPPRRFARAQARPDVTVKHEKGLWTVRDTALQPIFSVTDTVGVTVNELCNDKMRHVYVNVYGHTGTDRICAANQGMSSTDKIFLGDLGTDWLGIEGYDRLNIGPVSSLATDGQGRVYAGVSGGAQPGVHMFDAVGGALTPSGTITLNGAGIPGGVLEVAFANNRLFTVDENGYVNGYDFNNTPSTAWSVFNGGGPSMKVRALGDAVVYSDANAFYLTDVNGVASGSPCGRSSSDFQLLRMHWSGSSHLIVAYGSGSQVRFLSMETCQDVGTWELDYNRNVNSLTLSQGMLLVGVYDYGLWMLNPAEILKQGMATILSGDRTTAKGVIVGPYIYTAGGDKARIIQIH